MADDTQVLAAAGAQGLSHTPFNRGVVGLLAARRGELEECQRRFLSDGSNGEALHDLRVATRRLRSLIDGYHRYLLGEEGLCTQLRALQQQSNPARDLEVFIALIAQCGPATAALIPPLQGQLDNHYRQLRQQLPAAWQQLEPLLAALEGVPPANAPHTPLGAVCADEAARHHRRLKQGLKGLRKKWDDRRAHRLRITGKRLRYLLEPFVEDSAVAQAVDTLKRFQDSLGDYHDSDLLQQQLTAWHPSVPLDTAQSAALEALRAQLKGRHRQLRREIRQAYLKGGRKAFLRQLKRALHTLVQPAGSPSMIG